ncbi:hypothetical protein U1Q18_018133 [Sarracenia purpurea var. burkii]
MEPSKQMDDAKKQNGKARLVQSCRVQQQNNLSICLPVDGISGQPGCVRYCAGFKLPNFRGGSGIGGDGDDIVYWVKEKLLSFDPNKLTFSYAIIDGNIDFNSYVSKIQVVPKECGCSIEWCHEVEPVEGWTPGDLDSHIASGLQVMAKRIEAAILAANQIRNSP